MLCFKKQINLQWKPFQVFIIFFFLKIAKLHQNKIKMLKKSHCSQIFITLDCRKKSDKPKVWNVQYLTNFYPMEATLLPP